MRELTWIFWANLTPFSLKIRARRRGRPGGGIEPDDRDAAVRGDDTSPRRQHTIIKCPSPLNVLKDICDPSCY